MVSQKRLEDAHKKLEEAIRDVNLVCGIKTLRSELKLNIASLKLNNIGLEKTRQSFDGKIGAMTKKLKKVEGPKKMSLQEAILFLRTMRGQIGSLIEINEILIRVSESTLEI